MPLPGGPLLCVVCRTSLGNKRCHNLPPGPERNIIAKQISPREIPPGGLVCYTCWQYAGLIRKRNPEPLEQPAAPHDVPVPRANVCLVCQRSLNSRRRRNNLPAGPITDDIAARIHPRQIPVGGLVCYACWLQARRNVERRERERANQSPNPNDDNHDVVLVCTWCEQSIDKERSHALSHGSIRDTVAARIYPRKLPDGAVLCPDCWTRADCWTKAHAEGDETESDEELQVNEIESGEELQINEIESGEELQMDEKDSDEELQMYEVEPGEELQMDEIEPIEELQMDEIEPGEELQMDEIEPIEELQMDEIESGEELQMDKMKPGQKLHPHPDIKRIALRNFRITTRSNSHCFVPGCKGAERLNVPNNLRRHILKCKKVFVNAQSRICKEHQMCRNFDFLNAEGFSPIFTADEAEEALNLSIQEDE